MDPISFWGVHYKNICMGSEWWKKNEEVLSRGKADVNAEDQGDPTATALFYASWKGHHNIVVELLKSPDLDLSKQNDNGDTALIQAAWSGHKEIMRILLADKRQKTSVNVKSKSGKNAWSVAREDLKETGTAHFFFTGSQAY